ncbi:MAG TPA: hypothetical protein PKI14_09500 [Fervidobacterium sp.]|jgi:hypothetical protein|nr:hypothetical protein [Fervidobacterium sp.]HUM43170.1 hypothetical protein [Fervidobacterium sp.]
MSKNNVGDKYNLMSHFYNVLYSGNMKAKRRKGVKIMILGLTSILLAAVIIVFIASGVFLKSNYLEPWQKSYSDRFDD